MEKNSDKRLSRYELDVDATKMAENINVPFHSQETRYGQDGYRVLSVKTVLFRFHKRSALAVSIKREKYYFSLFLI